jgi:hypothetical protein
MVDVDHHGQAGLERLVDNRVDAGHEFRVDGVGRAQLGMGRPFDRQAD